MYRDIREQFPPSIFVQVALEKRDNGLFLIGLRRKVEDERNPQEGRDEVKE
ncbi:hypothetical protein SAMN05518847_109119 [Paenibacillus sp. OV219]|nr:hypothetical protein SAMN05518847_109119 [Paenibacillus sp. OV219]